MQTKQDLLSTGQAADMLNCGRFMITKWLREGVLKGVKLSPRLWRVERSEIERLMTQGYCHE